VGEDDGLKEKGREEGSEARMGDGTHPSVSWKLTFTFFADPRSSETQTKWNINGFFQLINGRSPLLYNIT